jgi:hypothetical protein
MRGAAGLTMRGAAGLTMRGAAGGAQSARLDDLPADDKAAILAKAAQAEHNRLVLYFLGGAAIVANHELALVRMLNIVARDKRAHTFDFMDELVEQQKIERAINRRRADLAALVLQSSEERIRADRLIGSENKFEHASAYRRQAPATGGAELLRAVDVPRSHDYCLSRRPGDNHSTSGIIIQRYSVAPGGSNKERWWTIPLILPTLDI